MFFSREIDQLLNICLIIMSSKFAHAYCEVKASILATSYDVMSCLYQFSDFTLKSTKTTIRNGSWLANSTRVNSRLSAN